MPGSGSKSFTAHNVTDSMLY